MSGPFKPYDATKDVAKPLSKEQAKNPVSLTDDAEWMEDANRRQIRSASERQLAHTTNGGGFSGGANAVEASHPARQEKGDLGFDSMPAPAQQVPFKLK